MQRYIRLDVCDYTGKALCNLYDSSQDISGQAHDVFVHSERNGFKELKFQLPSVLQDGEKNYRLDYLISDYRIKLLVTKGTDMELDWFLISESKVEHNNLSQNFEIRAGHISNLLNMKNLDLEFSIEEGNNVGTIEQIAATILEGTGWHLGDVRKFYEDKKYGYGEYVEKVRTFTSSAQTGAFKMMSDLCELFDAKPIYHGYGKYIEDGEEKYGRTVDIIPMNPFSEDFDEGTIPPDILENEILELHYDKNVKSIARTLNTDNITTRLSAYGSVGDREGACTLQDAMHIEVTFNEPVTPGEYCFEFQNGKYFFTATASTDSLKWSTLDFSSRSYVYDGTNLYRVYREPVGSYTTLTTTEEVVKNHVTYLMDFTYYDKVGLLTDEMLQVIANHQKTIPDLYIAANEASLDLAEAKAELSRTASAGEGFLMFDISASTLVDGYLQLTLDKTTYDGGVIFRSDYDESKRNYFRWNVATGIKDSGEAIAGRGAVVYIVHEGNPTKWEKSYLKYIGNGTANYFTDELGNDYTLANIAHYDSYDLFPISGTENTLYIADDTGKLYVWKDEYIEVKAADYVYGLNEFEEPSTVTLWMSDDTWHSGDKVYMFSADSIAGLFGPREDAVLSNQKSIEESIKTVTEIHPLYFITNDEPIPAVDACLSSYGWYYHNNTNVFSLGDLHFCWGSDGDLGWSNVYISKNDNNPEELDPSDLPGYGYYYSIKKLMLYKAGTDAWVPVKGTVDKDRLTAAFASVIVGCINQEILTKGVKEQYHYTGSTSLPIGNYAFKSEFDNYWLFTTDKYIDISTDDLRYDYETKLVWQDEDEHNVVKPVEHSFTILEFPSANDLYGVPFSEGNYSNGEFTTGNQYQISNNIYVHEDTTYEFSLPASSIVVCLDTNNRVLSEETTSPFVAPNNTTHVRVVCLSVPTSSHYLRVQNYDNVLFSKNKMYTILPCEGSGDRLGLNYLMDKFIELAHEAYEVKLPALRQAKQDIKDADHLLSETLGDIFREGCWQQNDYSEGDEQKLYSDTLDNLKEISHPEAEYEVTFLDLYGSQPLTEDEEETPWPDIEISYAAHLVDMDIDTNKWAYIDVLDKCYDKPWETTLEINTRLSMIGQQSFTDVLTRIAEIANETKANQSVYKRAAALTSSGQMAAERLEGAIQTNKLYITSGASNWYTDNKGNIIFESADGSSAMMLSGRGWAVSQTKDVWGDWDWRYIGTGQGLTADAIYTGYLSAERIEAGSITTDKLSSNVGQELEIGSNKALTMFATVDGTRPAGSLVTQHPNEGDSWVAIGAQDGNNPAYVDIQSGGKVNIYGTSEVDIGSQGSLNIDGGTVNLTSGGEMNITGGTVEVVSTGTLLVDSSNFKIQRDSVTGLYNVTIKGGVNASGTSNIAGFTVGVANQGQQNEINYLYAGQTTSMSSQAQGVYIGTDGINLAGKFKVTNAGALTATSGEVGGWTISTNKLSSGSGNNYVALSSTDTDYRIWAGNETASSAPFSVSKTGSLVAKSGEIGGWTIGATSLTGNKTGLAKTSQDSDIAIWAGNATSSSANFYVRQDGYMKSSSGTIGGWNIGSDYIGNNTTKNASTTGIAYISTTATNDAISFWAGGAYNGTGANAPKFSVTRDGSLTASSGKVGNWYISDTHIGNASTESASSVGLKNSTTSSDIVLWAGNSTKANSNFTLTAGGDIKANSGRIGDWYIGSGYLGNANTLNGSTVGLAYKATTATGTDIVFWSGGAYNGTGTNTPTFRVTKAGKLYATDAEITGTVSSGSTIACNISASLITSDTMSAERISGGTLTLGGNNNTNGQLSIKNASNVVIGSWTNTGITAEAGSIGGWTINTKNLTSGTGTATVTLNSDTTTTNVKDYAMWAGNSLPTGNSAAPFRVKRDGTVYLKQLVTVAENQTETTVDLTSYPLWKLNYRTVKSLTAETGTDGTVTLTLGTSGGDLTANFNSASSMSISGGAGSVYIVNGTTTVTGTSKTVTVNYRSSGTASYSSSGTLTIPVRITLGGTTTINDTVVYMVDRSGSGLAYDSGYSAGTSSVTITSVAANEAYPTATLLTLIATASNGKSQTGSVDITSYRNNAYNEGVTYGESKFSLATITLQGEQDNSCYTASQNGTVYYQKDSDVTYYKGNGDKYSSATRYHIKGQIAVCGSVASPVYSGQLYYPGGQSAGSGTWYRTNATLYMQGPDVDYVDSTTADTVLIPNGSGTYVLRGDAITVTPIKSTGYIQVMGATRWRQGTTVSNTYYTKTS